MVGLNKTIQRNILEEHLPSFFYGAKIGIIGLEWLR